SEPGAEGVARARDRGDGDPQSHARRRAAPLLHALLGQRRCGKTRRRAEGGAGANQHRQKLNVARVILLAAVLLAPIMALAQVAPVPLALAGKIPLGDVRGRIDHLGVDLKRQRLYVAELGNNSLGVVDLAAGKVLRTIGGFREPQGVAYVPFTDSVYAANA